MPPPLLLLALFPRGCVFGACYRPAAAISAFGIKVLGLRQAATHTHGHVFDDLVDDLVPG